MKIALQFDHGPATVSTNGESLSFAGPASEYARRLIECFAEHIVANDGGDENSVTPDMVLWKVLYEMPNRATVVNDDPITHQYQRYQPTNYDFNPADHPRGQPDNAGQFASGGGNGGGQSSGSNQSLPTTNHPLSGSTAASAVHAALPQAARDRLSSRLARVENLPTIEAVTDAWYAAEANPPPADKRTPCLGFYDPQTGVLYAGPGNDKVDPTGTLAHEIGHALDTENGELGVLSMQDEFRWAWSQEMKHGQLTNYAAYDEIEGFGELIRLIYGSADGLATAERQFPKCLAYFRRMGLV